MPRGTKVPITPGVLDWSLTSAGLTPADLAERLHVNMDMVRRWLDGSEQPSLTQFRAVGRVVRRPPAVLLLPKPPSFESPRVRFRASPGVASRSIESEELCRIREAGRLQKAVAWIQNELGDESPRLLRTRVATNPRSAASQMRAHLGVSTVDQLAWRSESDALREWRRALENAGVLVFMLPMGRGTARGFSIWHEGAPMIAVNTHWRAEARIFTLFHELGHLITRTNSICSDVSLGVVAADGDGDVERWCERFAAALLMPEEAVRSALQDLDLNDHARITDLDVAGRVARRFKVSLRAAVIRLIGLDLARWDLYAGILPSSDAKRSGGGGTGRTRPQVRLDEYGHRTARAFLRGLQRDVIDASTVMRYLDVTHRDLTNLGRMAS
jgi:Zn-dependent peptidase ImmA (M78 family)